MQKLGVKIAYKNFPYQFIDQENENRDTSDENDVVQAKIFHY